MPTRKLLYLMLIPALFALLSFRAATYVQAWAKAPVGVTVQRTEVFYKFPSGERSRSQKTTLGIRDDGSNVEIVYGKSPDGRDIKQKRIVDRARRIRVVEDELTESLTTFHLSDQGLNGFLIGDGECPPPANASTEKRLGYTVYRVRKEMGSDNGIALASEAWIAPDLNCLALVETRLATPAGSDKAQVTNVRTVDSIVLGNPHSELFAFRAEFTERPPSGVIAEFQRRYPNAVRNEAVSNAITLLDPGYKPPQPR